MVTVGTTRLYRESTDSGPSDKNGPRTCIGSMYVFPLQTISWDNRDAVCLRSTFVFNLMVWGEDEQLDE